MAAESLRKCRKRHLGNGVAALKAQKAAGEESAASKLRKPKAWRYGGGMAGGESNAMWRHRLVMAAAG